MATASQAPEGLPPTHGKERFNLRKFLFSGSGWPYLLVPFIPIAIVLEFIRDGLVAAIGPDAEVRFMNGRAEQITVANRLYASSGTSPWGCA